MITILHVDTELTWRGGEAQVLQLASLLPVTKYRSIVAGPRKSAIIDRCIESGIPVFPLSGRTESSPRLINDIFKAVRRFKPQIIHVHTSHGLISAALAALFLEPHPKVVHSRRTDFHLKTSFLGISKKRYLWCTDRIVTVSDGIKRVLIQDGLPEQKIKTVYSGIDINRFIPGKDREDARCEFGIKPDEVMAGMVGALVPHKDPLNFIRAAEKTALRVPLSRFMLVGAGSLMDEVRNYVARSAIADRVILTGFRNDIPRLLAAFDIFCMSSREEGLCTSILDAMAMGLPVAATRAGGIPEAVEDHVTGLLAPVETPEALANCMIELLTNKELAVRFGSAARKRVIDKFSIESTVAKTADIYEELFTR